ncbi:hypothetical protein [Dyella acidisoli]|uniref:Ribosomal protein L7/L12 C-terminal domain-containing protein n=1 Tax=Dyella acidisoli TaxID=1867834 RepID=A0ABQ5XUL2_9GAMM|nr:hypothetical protein [Dyella acidisoli]GLQ95474.1 hypothetical protein GCM10007901_44290 [Dyella acidisoli]
MVELVVACFDTQFEANAAAERLLSRGLQREQIVLSFDESVDHSASSSSAPTTVVSKASHTGRMDTSTGRKKRKSLPSLLFASSRTPPLPDPSLIGHTTLIVELHGEMSMDDACTLLDIAGASSVRSQQHAKKPIEENPEMWPSVGHASREDVQRSIEAAKGGATLRTRTPGKT